MHEYRSSLKKKEAQTVSIGRKCDVQAEFGTGFTLKVRYVDKVRMMQVWDGRRKPI